MYHPSLLIGSSNGEIPPEKAPIQDTGSYSLNSPVQDILDERPELLKAFREEMDKDDIWGNGWKRWDIVVFIISQKLMVVLVYSSVLGYLS